MHTRQQRVIAWCGHQQLTQTVLLQCLLYGRLARGGFESRHQLAAIDFLAGIVGGVKFVEEDVHGGFQKRHTEACIAMAQCRGTLIAPRDNTLSCECVQKNR